MQKIFDVINAVFQFILDIPEWILSVIINLITSFLTMLKDLFLWALDALLQLAASLIAAIDLTPLIQMTSNFDSLPSEIINILALCRVGEALGIIVTALIIRFTLQLIPFVRLGS